MGSSFFSLVPMALKKLALFHIVCTSAVRMLQYVLGLWGFLSLTGWRFCFNEPNADPLMHLHPKLSSFNLRVKNKSQRQKVLKIPLEGRRGEGKEREERLHFQGRMSVSHQGLSIYSNSLSGHLPNGSLLKAVVVALKQLFCEDCIWDPCPLSATFWVLPSPSFPFLLLFSS